MREDVEGRPDTAIAPGCAGGMRKSTKETKPGGGRPSATEAGGLGTDEGRSPRSTPRPSRRPEAGTRSETPSERRGADDGELALVAVDAGGTFTDLLAFVNGALRSLKIPSTPDDPSQAALDGLRRLLGNGRPAFALLHGTTVATNALLERKGARVGLITNRGFEDVLEIGRQNRPQLYALVGERKPPLVARDDRIGIAGRLDPQGAELQPLDADELRRLPARAAEFDALAVCLLHSYAQPAHEEVVAAALASAAKPVSVSSRILPEFREYERASTTVVNAYVAPLVSGYLAKLAERAGAARVRVMGSNGGAMPVDRAAREPVHTVLSGPAGGLVGAADAARRAGFEKIVAFDMGGTSTDVSICPGETLATREFSVDGQPVAIPVLDIHTVGAGGGSIARLDAGGALKVGPESAGAAPGPACYGRGGDALTVTDAHVWLGRLPAERFLGGATRLDRDAIRPVLARVADGLGTNLEAAAEGVVAVANSAMERALRVISVERGYDPKDFCLVAFGGAGGLHAAELASRIGMASVLAPPDPGLLSAYGMLVAPVSREASRTVLGRQVQALDAIFAELREAAVAELLAEGCPVGAVRVAETVDARYAGQSFELSVPAQRWTTAFHAAHKRRYGYDRPDSPVEAVTLRVVAEAPPPGLRLERPPRGAAPPPASTTVRTSAGSTATSLYARSALGAGAELAGPAVVTEYSGTTWIPGGWRCTVLDAGSLLLQGPPHERREPERAPGHS